MIRNSTKKRNGNEMSKIKLNNDGSVAGIEIVKVHFRHYFAKYDGKTLEGTRSHSEAGAWVQAKKILKDQAIVENGLYYLA